MQIVVCKIQKCGFRSVNGFCMKRVIAINEQGVCKYLTKQGWDREVEPFERCTWVPPEEEQEKELIEEKKESDLCGQDMQKSTQS